MNFLFNPAFILKPDDGRALLLDKDSTGLETGDENFDYFIHPVHAIILNSLNGSANSIESVSDYLNVDAEFTRVFVDSLTNNTERLWLSFEGITFIFPRYCIIKSEKTRESLDPELFLYDQLDLRKKRHLTPTDITLMINSKCATDCIYCYADRSLNMSCKISLERIFQLIREARSLHARSFEILGGELFLYSKWPMLLEELNRNGFKPFISTKVPLNERHVAILSEIQNDRLQVSLDTIIEKDLCDILQVQPPYYKKMKRFIELLDQYGVQFTVHTIVNSKNDRITAFNSLYHFLKEFKNLKVWRIDPAEPSLYLKSDYREYCPDPNSYEEIVSFLQDITDIQINYDSLLDKVHLQKNFHLNTFADQIKTFKSRTICSANRSQLFILPDGQVTTCEEFYWHPNFIIGDVTKHSLVEVWNSERALYLSFIPQTDIPEDSACRKCQEYKECREFTQVCFRDIMKAHGKEKWHYPDVRCPKSPLVQLS